MLIRRSGLLAVAALSLAACGQSDDTDGAPKASLSASGEPLRAGLYKVAQTGDVEIEDERCFRIEDINGGRFAVSGSADDGWIVDRNRMSGGIIQVAAHHPSGSRLELDGTFERESFVVDGTMVLKVGGETHIVRTRQRGEFASPTCPADTD